MSGKRILFIDGDEAFIRDIAGGVEHQGYQAVLTGSSVEGVDLARTERPDLIVVSVELTPAAGWSVCTRLKKDEELKDIPLILTSSTSTQDTFEKHKKLKTRADEYLLKPYSVDELLRLAGPLLGLAETISEDDLIAEDESLSSGGYDSGTEEEIHIAADEPLANGHDLGDVSLDPLAGSSDDLLDEDSLGDLGEDDTEAPRPGLPPDASGDDMDAFEHSFDQLSGGDEAPPLAPPAETEALHAENEEALVDFSEELNAEIAAEAAPAEESFDTQLAPLEDPEVAFVEAAPPEEIAAELSEPAVEQPVAEPAPEAYAAEPYAAEPEPFAADEGAFEAEDPPAPAPTMPPPARPAEPTVSAADSNRVAELEAQLASLEAELEGFRATEGSHHQDVERVRAESARKDEEIDKLHDQVRERERQIRELKDSDSRASMEAAKARDERLKRDAQIKSLTQRTETMSAAGQKLERDLATAREEASAVAPLKSRVAELEEQLKIAQAGAAEAKSLRDEVDKGRRDLDRVRAAHGQAVIDLESHRTDLEAARTELAEATRVGNEQTALAIELQAKLTDVEEKMQNFAALAQSHGDRAGKARAQLLALAEELGLKH